MKVIIGSDSAGVELKEYLKKIISQNDNFQLIDVSEAPVVDFVEATNKVVEELQKDDNSLGIAIDAYGAGSFMVATKHPGIIAAEVSDERSAYMTREHNNSRMITMGSEIVGKKLAENIALAFLNASYDGGRHQIRVDMLNEMY